MFYLSRGVSHFHEYSTSETSCKLFCLFFIYRFPDLQIFHHFIRNRCTGVYSAMREKNNNGFETQYHVWKDSEHA